MVVDRRLKFLLKNDEASTLATEEDCLDTSYYWRTDTPSVEKASKSSDIQAFLITFCEVGPAV